MKWIAPIVIFAALAGCTSKNEAQPSGTPQIDTGSARMGHATHEADHGSGATAMLMVESEPVEAKAAQPTTLRLMIHEASGAMVKDFEQLQEQKVHLIIASEGLDQFAHVHPQIDLTGTMTTVFSFPTGGKYRLYADYQPTGKGPAVAISEMKIAGETPRAPDLKPNAPGQIKGDGLSADVSIDDSKANGATRIVFRLLDASGTSVVDLQPYMGAMGHLVIISADGKQYVHAHSKDKKATDGKVEFEAHIMKPGIYKAWGQFQREGAVRIVPFVMEKTL